MRNLNGTGTLLAFGFVSSALAETTLKIEKFLPEGTKYYPPGSPEAYENCRDGYHGCYVSEGEPLEGIAQVLALVGALVFVVAVVAYIIWSIKKQKRQQSLDSQNPS